MALRRAAAIADRGSQPGPGNRLSARRHRLGERSAKSPPGGEIRERERMARRVADHDRGRNAQPAVGVQEFPGRQRPPPRVLVHRLGRNHDRGPQTEVGRANAQRAEGARMVESPARGHSLEHMELVRARVAQRPQFVSRRQHDVEGEQRQLLGDPAGRGDQTRGHIAAMLLDLLADQSEEALGVGVAADEAAIGPELRLELGQIPDHAVVGQHATVLLERMGVRGC